MCQILIFALKEFTTVVPERHLTAAASSGQNRVLLGVC
jgi:hypothetical protein